MKTLRKFIVPTVLLLACSCYTTYAATIPPLLPRLLSSTDRFPIVNSGSNIAYTASPDQIVGYVTNTMQVVGATLSNPGGKPTLTIDTPSVKKLGPSFFGVHYNHSSTYNKGANPQTPYVPMGFKSFRLWDTQTNWMDLEIAKGVFNWTNLDYLVDWSIGNGMDVLMCLGQPPAWATGGARTSDYGTHYNATPPTSNQDWIDYLTAVGNRYKGRIKYYEIWNEPQDTNFYNGTAARLAELTQLANQTLKGIDPTIKIVSASPVGSSITFFDSYLAAGAAANVDIAAYHFYVNPLEPEAMIDRAQKVRAIMAKNGIGSLPLWNTESGWFSWNDGGTMSTDDMTDKQAAAYVIRSFIASWVAGFDRSYFYSIDNSGGVAKLINMSDSTPTAAGNSVKRFIEWAAGQQLIGFSRNDDGTYVLTTSDGNGRHWMVWTNDTSGTSMQLASESGVQSSTAWDGTVSYLSSSSLVAADMAPLLLRGANEYYGKVSIYTPTPPGEVGGVILANDGSSAAPGIAFSNATNTGIKRSPDGSLAFVEGGTAVMALYGDSFRFPDGNYFTDQSHGNRWLKFRGGNTVMNTATNYLTVTNAAIGTGPTLSAGSGSDTVLTGWDTNIDINIAPLGTGRVNILGKFNVGAASTPASSTATCTTGDVVWDSSYIYQCIATNTWKRSALSTW